jgi:hypothetical protein
MNLVLRVRGVSLVTVRRSSQGSVSSGGRTRVNWHNKALDPTATTAENVEEKYYDCDHQQSVNQASPHGHGKAEKP